MDVWGEGDKVAVLHRVDWVSAYLGSSCVTVVCHNWVQWCVITGFSGVS